MLVDVATSNKSHRKTPPVKDETDCQKKSEDYTLRGARLPDRAGPAA